MDVMRMGVGRADSDAWTRGTALAEDQRGLKLMATAVLYKRGRAKNARKDAEHAEQRLRGR